MSAEEENVRPNPAWKIALVGGPLFLALSGAVAMWISWKKSENPQVDPRLALQAEQVSVEELDDHLRKLGTLIGERDWESELGRKSMRRAVAFIEGTLSPQNYGFEAETGEILTHAGERWPTIWADLKGTTVPAEVVLVVAAYDGGDAEVAVALSAANDLRDEKLGKTVRFVFFPSHLYAEGEGKDITDVLTGEESHRIVLHADLPGGIGTPRAGPGSGADLEPIARELVEKVRTSAR